MKSKSKALSRQDEIPPNDENRNVIFNAFDSLHILNLNFKDVVTFYKYCWFFLNTASPVSGLANKAQIKDKLVGWNSPVKFNTKDKYVIGSFADFLGTMDLVNLKHFVSWAQAEVAFNDFKAASFIKRITAE
jgi:hypothetical protein